MTVVSGPSSAGLIARVQNMITRPAAEWDVIAPEQATVGGLYTGYACILAAIPAIGSVLGTLLIAHLAVIGAVVGGVISYVLTLVGIYAVAFVVDAMAPSFGAEKSQIQALKLLVYASTAAWVAGIANIIPFLGWIVSLAGIGYSIYTLYLGLPKMMKCPADKVAGYFVVTILAYIIVFIIIYWIVAMIVAAMAFTAIAAGGAALSGVH